MTGIEACEDIVKYAEELSKHSHEDLYCRMYMWAKAIRKELVEGQKPTTNSDYAAALRVIRELRASNSNACYTVDLEQWCKLRLNA